MLFPILAGIFAGFVLLFLHYFPYPKVFGGPLPRLGSYVMGVGAITVGQVGVHVIAPDRLIHAVVIVPAVVGLFVFVAWAFDYVVDLRAGAKDAEDAATAGNTYNLAREN